MTEGTVRAMKWLHGFIAPVFTPFEDAEGHLNLSIIPAYAEYLSKHGVKGVLVNGTSGEGMSMTVLERKAVAEAWAAVAACNNLHLMIQVGGAPFPDVIELARHAREINADSILCLPDLYFKPADEKQLLDYLDQVARAASQIPLLYYHIPMFTNVNLNMRRLFELAKNRAPWLAGIKFTSTNLEEASQALRVEPGRFHVFLGSDQIMSAGCAVGIDSFIPTSVNIFPTLALEIAEAGQTEDARRAWLKQDKLSKAVCTISKHGHWVETMKEAMRICTSMNFGFPRKPLSRLTQDKIDCMTRELGIMQEIIHCDY